MRPTGATLALAALLAAAAPAVAVEPGERLADPALEARARTLSAELRCLVCQNQSIDDSDAPLARDLRVLLRERITAGDSDAAVKAFLTARYGDFILLRPPLKASTVLLWAAPFAALAAGAILAWRLMRRRVAAGEAPEAALSAEEEKRLAALTGAEGGPVRS